MRPTLESDKDREEQARIAAFIEKRWDCVATPLPRYSPVDYVLTKQPIEEEGKVDALMEVKCRKGKMREEWPTYMLSLAKLLKMRELGYAMNVPAILVIEWTDAMGMVDTRKLKMNELGYYVGGRKDRPDPENPGQVIPGDIELTVRIPNEAFGIFTPEET
jgi:hypothetical protein